MLLPYDKQAYRILHKGVQALARVESNGIRMDEEYLDRMIKKLDRKIKKLERRLESTKEMTLWRSVYGPKTNLNSTKQLGHILFEKMEYEPPERTGTGRAKTDEKALRTLDSDFVRSLLEIRKLRKAITTYLKGIKREIVDGFLHPSFNLHTASTYRSSSDSPNFQNIPIRDPEMGKLIRKTFRARKNHHLVEIDYGALEVRIAACYHKDPTMISYICDESKDMHRDMAAECFMLPHEEVSKQVRYCGKNMFVFPQFYGDWYIDCAKHLWEAVDELNLQTNSGKSVSEHLGDKGIIELGELDPDFEDDCCFVTHIRNVEKRFWKVRFPVYDQWKRDWYQNYLEKGFFKTKTGFVCSGYMKKNEVINYPVQGSAFHCLLWALTRLVMTELPKRKMKTLIVGQIHDSIVADVPKEELDDYLVLANYVMTKLIRKVWDWIAVPLIIEAEVSPPGGSWAEKEEVPIPE